MMLPGPSEFLIVLGACLLFFGLAGAVVAVVVLATRKGRKDHE